MLQRTNKILIGQDIARDTDLCVDGASILAFSKTTGIASGEILVLDKQKKILAAGATILDTDTIYICQGTSETFSFADEAGVTTGTPVRKVIVSDAIEGKKVKKYVGKSYTLKVERSSATTFTGFAPVAGTEYLIRIIYKDMVEHPGQFTQTYRYVCTTAGAVNLAAWLAAVVAVINKHKGRRILASENDTVMTLTALEKPECTTALTDIDEFDMVNFDVRNLRVSIDTATVGQWETIPSTSTVVTYTGPTFGSGNWEQIRDLEKGALGYVGVTNRTHFPVILPTMSTVVDSYYDLIVIEHDKSYLSPDNQYVKQAPLTTLVALATASTGINANNQCLNVLDRLNPWMESCGFDSITL